MIKVLNYKTLIVKTQKHIFFMIMTEGRINELRMNMMRNHISFG